MTVAMELEDKPGSGARVGTAVLYTMATSSPEEAPRGMEFLYSLDRLNVTTSWARCCCVLVANLRLFEPESRSVWQMRLAKGVCAYDEALEERVGAA